MNGNQAHSGTLGNSGSTALRRQRIFVAFRGTRGRSIVRITGVISPTAPSASLSPLQAPVQRVTSYRIRDSPPPAQLPEQFPRTPQAFMEATLEFQLLCSALRSGLRLRNSWQSAP